MSYQVTCEYRMIKGACIPIRVHTVVISVQHSEEVTTEKVRKDLMEQVIKVSIPNRYLDSNTVYHLQPSGRFVIGGPQVMKTETEFFSISSVSFIFALNIARYFLVEVA